MNLKPTNRVPSPALTRALTLALTLALAGSALADTIVIKEPEVRTIVTQAGYGDPVLVVRDGNLWRVQSLDNDGADEVTLFVNQEGALLGASEVVRERISKTTTTTTTTTTTEPERLTQPTSVAAVVREAGFHNVHDIDFSDNRGVWIAEADDITGEDFELHVDPETGLIVHIEDD
jgi:hypothetical protein